MARVRIQCINKTARTSPHERISHIGGINSDGSRWKMSTDQVIADIENGTYQFYVQIGLTNVDVIVSISAYGHKYLKTRNDSTTVDNLLSLPECN